MFNIFSYIQKDILSLRQYLNMESTQDVTFQDVVRNLFIMRRSDNVYLPDHYYKLIQNEELDGISSLSELISRGFSSFCCEFLEVKGKIVKVKSESLNRWQLNLVSISSLLAMSAVLQKKFRLDNDNLISYLNNYITPNVRFSTLPSAEIIQVDGWQSAHDGLCDLHAHLNGTLESDLVWQDFLEHPLDVYKEIKKNYDNSSKEQFNIVYPGLDPDLFIKFLYIAKSIRAVIYTRIVEGDGKYGIKDVIQRICLSLDLDLNLETSHPIELLIGAGYTPVQMEALFYIIVFQYLEENNDDYVSSLFYFYIQLQGLSNCLLVQQNNCIGFEQFDKYTQNGCREWSEQSYLRRFKQLAGNNLQHISLYEGRFAPKNTIKKNVLLLSRINDGWDDFQNLYEKWHHVKSDVKFGLIAHFIKKRDNKKDNICFYSLREDAIHKAQILSDLIYAKNQIVSRLVGADAAGNEIHTPPEVFAEPFRILRKSGINHFTYHAGEDFFHIISGVRSVYEAIVFLDLKNGDRIGHAVACGVDVSVWIENITNGYIDEAISIKKGEHLDNMAFLHHVITEYGIPELNGKLPLIESEIIKYGKEIFGHELSAHEYVNCWKSRGQVNLEDIIYDNSKYGEHALKYYERFYTEKYNQVIKLPAFKIVSAEEIKLVQHSVLKIMHDKEIVIETLPSSNVIIGHHKSFATYHLYNWYKMQKEGIPIPPIVVGTDDAGIFDTNIYNEYCHIYCQLYYDKKQNIPDIMAFLEELDRNSRLYAFR